MRKRRFKPSPNQRTEKRLDNSNPNRLFEGQIKKNKNSYGQYRELLIKKIEYAEYTCTKCGEIIKDLNSAIADKESGMPMHFDCVLEFLKKAEELKAGEEIIYIGNGNFAVAYFENPKIRKKFKIIKLIEWEDKNKLYQWKQDISDITSMT